MTTMLGCPKCRATNLKAWYRESVVYPITVVMEDGGAPETTYGEPTIEGSGDFDELWCATCDEPIPDDFDALKPCDEGVSS